MYYNGSQFEDYVDNFAFFRLKDFEFFTETCNPTSLCSHK